MQTGQSLAQILFGIPPRPIAPLQPQQSEAFQSIEKVQGTFTPFLEAGLSQMPRPPWVAARARAVAALVRLPSDGLAAAVTVNLAVDLDQRSLRASLFRQ
jgi:hypothetical protein